MQQIFLVVDLLIDEKDMARLTATKTPYLYTNNDNRLYTKHINHFDYHHPNLAISFGRDNHEIVNLKDGNSKSFYIDHRGIDKRFSVAMGVTDDLAMIAIGDADHTKIQVVDVDQPLKVHINEDYQEENEGKHYPFPRYFTGNSSEAQLVFADGSKLPVDLEEFKIGERTKLDMDRIILNKTVVHPNLSILGPFILISIKPDTNIDDIRDLELLVEKSHLGSWYAIDEFTLVCEENLPIDDYNDLIQKRKDQTQKLLDLIRNR